jgi:hypothetical protein
LNGAVNTFKKDNVFSAIASYHLLGKENTSKRVENFFKKLGYISKSEYPTHLTTFSWREY